MTNPKDILVTTTPSIDGLKIKKYLKPVSAHVVAGTGLISDFFASFSDIFGGRSKTYQKQLTSLYSETIEKIKYAAYEIGANCIVGLKIDMDEISGKDKSMFMLTAVGTAVVIEEKSTPEVSLPEPDEKLENVGIDKINLLRNRKGIIEKANSNKLTLDDDVWRFITANQVYEIFPFILKNYIECIPFEQSSNKFYQKFYKLFVNYIDAFPENKKLDVLYNGVKEQQKQIADKLSGIIQELNLFDFTHCMELLNSDDFEIQKRAVRLTTYDKPFYNKQDKQDLLTIRDFLKTTFVERGQRTMKKQLLSSKEKEAWICECGKTNDKDTYCYDCGKDIYGFTPNEMSASTAINLIEQKIELISEYIE